MRAAIFYAKPGLPPLAASSHVVFPDWFGAKLDGVTDDSKALQDAEDFALSMGRSVCLNGVALIKKPLKISAPWFGIKGKSKIIVAQDFSYSSNTGGESLAAIINKNFSLAYDVSTADYFYFVNIECSLEQNIGLSKSLIVLANVKGGLIDGVNAYTNTTALSGSLLDLYSCVKNLTVRGSSFANLTQAASGGAVWIRNITSDGSNVANVTENILFDQSKFITTTVDEAIAVYGVRGKTRNVTVRRCAVIGGTSGVKHGTLASAFPLNDGSLIGGINYASVEGVLYDDCDFIDDNFSDHVLRFGNAADVAQQCENIKVRASRFHVKQSAARICYAVRAIKCVGDGLTVESCHIDASNSPQVITYAISGVDCVIGNSVLGNITYAVDSCKLVSSNPSLVSAIGTVNCRDVRNNRIFSSSLGVLSNGSSTYNISNNYIEMTAAGTGGIFFNTLGNTTTPNSDALGNTIVMANAAGFAVQCSGNAPGSLRILNNKITGVGKSISGKFTQISDNEWYGKLDAIRAAGYIDFDHNSATPVGTFAATTVPIAGTTRIQSGWIKTANAGTGADWKSVFIETANN